MPRTALDLDYSDQLGTVPRGVSADPERMQRWQEHQNELQAQENQIAAQNQKQLATTAGTDASSWTTIPQYAGKSFAQAPAEAQQHFVDAYGGMGADAWNQAQIQRGAQTQALDEQKAATAQGALTQKQQADQQTGQTMANDATQWALNPTYAGKSFADAPTEARQHMIDAYSGNVAAVPQAWNNAQRAVTGDPNIGNVTKQDVAFDPALTGDDALKGMKANEAAFSKRLANYELPITSLSRFPADQKARIIAGASAYDPSFDAKEYPARQALQTGFKNGPQAQAITSLNTVMGHLDSLEKASKELGNYDTQALNYVRNGVRNQAGSPVTTKFNENATAVESELAKLFKGTGAATNQETQEWRKSFNSNMSPAQIHEAITKAVELIGSRTEALKNQYEQGFKKPKDRQWLTPKSREILGRLGGNPDEFDPVSGTVQPATTPQQAAPASQDQFETGKSYRDAAGNSATYLGNGKWKE